MKILKFGGSVLKSIKGFGQMVQILKSTTYRPIIVVVSAFSHSTKRLVLAANLAEQGNLQEAQSILKQLIEFHKYFAKNIILNSSNLNNLNVIYDTGFRKILELLTGLSITNELTPRTLDIIMSYGEYFALKTVSEYLFGQDINHKCCDATEIIVTNNTFGAANPLIEPTLINVKNKLLPFFENNDIILIQGFVGKNHDGEVTTMGIESSNLTAVLLASLTETQDVTFWTDVEGISSIDPAVSLNIYPIKKISYSDALKFAYSGLKLFYSDSIKLAMDNNIILRYKSAFNPFGSYTIVSDKADRLNKNIIIYKKYLNKDDLDIEINGFDDSKRGDLTEINIFHKENESQSRILSILSDCLLKKSFKLIIDNEKTKIIIKISESGLIKLLKDINSKIN